MEAGRDNMCLAQGLAAKGTICLSAYLPPSLSTSLSTEWGDWTSQGEPSAPGYHVRILGYRRQDCRASTQQERLL